MRNNSRGAFGTLSGASPMASVDEAHSCLLLHNRQNEAANNAY